MATLLASAALLSIFVMFLGELTPLAPERLRGQFSWSLEERIHTFQMYETSARNALNQIKKHALDANVTFPLFPNRSNDAELVGSPPSLCVGILTARRIKSDKSYLLQLVGSMSARMNIPSDDAYLHVFNVDLNPVEHKEAAEISDIMPVTVLKARHKDAEGFKLTLKQQEALDYAEGLRIFGKMGCENSLMIEDDAFASDNWIDQTKDALNQLRQQSDWFLVKMYGTRDYARMPRGKQRLYQYDQGYGTVAVLFNGKHTESFISALENNVFESLRGDAEFLPKDVFMSRFSRQKQWPIQTFEPVVFQHTGIHSAVSNARSLSADFPQYMSARNFVSEGVAVTFDPSRFRI